MADRGPDRILFRLKTAGPQTAVQLSEALGMTPTGARQHLADLAAEGLIEGETTAAARGRPSQTWRLSETGHARFPDRHAELTLELIRSTEAVFGAAGLDKLIRHREKASRAAYRAAVGDTGGIEERLERLAAQRSAEGYMAAWSRSDDGSFLFIEDHCPICAAATLCQGFCRSELQIFRAVLGPDVKVERTEHVLAGARRCAYRVIPI
jgi:predicted ArsR family transcriptional regulator